VPPRNPIETKRQIVAAAFWEIYRHGFQCASIDRIIDGTSVTRGALFHHFPTKQHLGYAVVQDAIRPWIQERWIAPLATATDATGAIETTIRSYLDTSPDEVVLGGCPLNNLTQEMAALDEGFRVRLDRIAEDWRVAVAGLLRNGPSADQDADRLAAFVVCSIEGLLAAAKLARSRAAADEASAVLVSLLRGPAP
jgi:AcrR family transcriptional regulator